MPHTAKLPLIYRESEQKAEGANNNAKDGLSNESETWNGTKMFHVKHTKERIFAKKLFKNTQKGKRKM